MAFRVTLVDERAGRTAPLEVQPASAESAKLFATLRDAAHKLLAESEGALVASPSDVQLSYRDSDNDLIKINSEEEAFAALACVSQPAAAAAGGLVLYASRPLNLVPRSLAQDAVQDGRLTAGRAPAPLAPADCATLQEALADIVRAAESILSSVGTPEAGDLRSRVGALRTAAAQLAAAAPATPAVPAAALEEAPFTTPVAGPLPSPGAPMSPVTPAAAPRAAAPPANHAPAVHKDVRCDSCHQWPVRGTRFKCAQCENFDLCAECEAANRHDPRHILLKIRVPRQVKVMHAAGSPPEGSLVLPRGAVPRVPSAGRLHASFPSPALGPAPAPAPAPVPSLLSAASSAASASGSSPPAAAAAPAPAPADAAGAGASAAGAGASPSPADDAAALGESFVVVPGAASSSPEPDDAAGIGPVLPAASSSPHPSFSPLPEASLADSSLLALSDAALGSSIDDGAGAGLGAAPSSSPRPPKEPGSPPSALGRSSGSLGRILTPEEFACELDLHEWQLVESRREIEALLSASTASLGPAPPAAAAGP
eukprot:tig00000654_g2815.t1